MSDPDFDTQAAESILATLSRTADWSPEESQADSPNSSIGESRAHPERSRYVGIDTDGHLIVTIPAPTNGVAEFLLVNPLDATLAENNGPFVTALGEAHSQRAKKYCQSYFEPLKSPNLIAKGHIPSEFDREKLQSELHAVYVASQLVDDLHRQLWTTLAS